ncbi:hypothetical protein MA16_Dca022774 [Dendrobium catenatum]|uniref:Uncharacterized protein n=1 Tax=Dendrobium catenatum TaxID=906689 RepID=A0A2I0VV92_9ASPA|nr:hypothetical protein MA16_Dca022774 [Dendrobium catenatum]
MDYLSEASWFSFSLSSVSPHPRFGLMWWHGWDHLLLCRICYTYLDSAFNLELPLEPSLSRTLIEANELGCLSQALTVVAMLSAEITHCPIQR